MMSRMNLEALDRYFDVAAPTDEKQQRSRREEPMTLQDLYREGIRKLTENEVPEAELKALYLLQSFLSEEPFSYTRSRFFLEQMEQAAPETITSYMEKVSKRKEHIPLEYILGYTEFMGLTFLVREGVLIQTHLTQILVEMAVEVST